MVNNLLNQFAREPLRQFTLTLVDWIKVQLIESTEVVRTPNMACLS